MNIRLSQIGCPTRVNIKDILDLDVISIIQVGGSAVWTGFSSMKAAVSFKEERGLDSSWRIRDRRKCASIIPGGHEAPSPIRDTALGCASMIRDHIRPTLGTLRPVRSKNETRFASEVTMFAAGLLGEQKKISTKKFCNWKPVLGRKDDAGWSWLQNGRGDILDIADIWEGGTLNFIHLGSKGCEAYSPHRVSRVDYDARIGSIWRGSAEHAGLSWSRQGMLGLYEILSLHMSLYIDKSHLCETADAAINAEPIVEMA